MDINNNLIIYYAKETKILRKKLKDGTFFYSENKFFIDDLFSISKIKEDIYNNKKPRIGKEFQAIIPDFNDKL